jgi:hypothetical protein
VGNALANHWPESYVEENNESMNAVRPVAARLAFAKAPSEVEVNSRSCGRISCLEPLQQKMRNDQHQEHKTSNPDKKSRSQLWRIDFLLIHHPFTGSAL